LGDDRINCHLRDTEREVHHLQINTLLEDTKPFVPRPDAAVWAKQRNYLNEDGRVAVKEFTSARIKTLEMLQGQESEICREPRVTQYSARQILQKSSNLWRTMIECTFNKPGIRLNRSKNAPHRIWMHRVITARITWEKRAFILLF